MTKTKYTSTLSNCPVKRTEEELLLDLYIHTGAEILSISNRREVSVESDSIEINVLMHVKGGTSKIEEEASKLGEKLQELSV